MTRGLLGLTVACARCHDHKFDPIPTDDYYSLYGVFASSVEPADLPEIPAPVPAALARRLPGQARREAEGGRRLPRRAAAPRSRPTSAARVAAYLRAAFDLGLRPPRTTRSSTSGPGPTSSPPAGSAASSRAGRRSSTRPAASHDPVFAPWHAFAALPAGGVRREGRRRREGAAPTTRRRSTRSSPARSPTTPPATMAEVAARYGDAAGRGRRRRRRRAGQGARRPELGGAPAGRSTPTTARRPRRPTGSRRAARPRRAEQARRS